MYTVFDPHFLHLSGKTAGFLFDTYHWSCEGARTDDLYFALAHVDRMCGFHVNDGVFGRTLSFQRDMERCYAADHRGD